MVLKFQFIKEVIKVNVWYNNSAKKIELYPIYLTPCSDVSA